MGNSESQEEKSDMLANQKSHQQKYILELRDREIIIDFKNKVKVNIGDILSFPSGFEGLHLWESNIILAKYIYKNKEMFAGKSSIELLSGTGIASIVLKKFTKTIKIAATDKKQQVIGNLVKNCQKNNIESGMIVANISWAEYTNYKTKFDFVIGADLLFQGSPIDLLLNVIDKLLNVGGKAIIVVPSKNLNNINSNDLTAKIDSAAFSFKKEKLLEEYYMESPLLNQVEGYEEFQCISSGCFYIYTMEKISELAIPSAELTEKEKDNDKEIILPKNDISNYSGEEKQNKETNKETIEIVNQEDIKSDYEREVERSDQLRKELEIVTIKKQEDIPEYEKCKRKDLEEIISEKSKSSSKEKREEEIDEIKEVEKEYQLHDQPDKRSSSGKKNSVGSNADQNCLNDANLEDIRMRKKSNPN